MFAADVAEPDDVAELLLLFDVAVIPIVDPPMLVHLEHVNGTTGTMWNGEWVAVIE
jgi:hypothetical protein